MGKKQQDGLPSALQNVCLTLKDDRTVFFFSVVQQLTAISLRKSPIFTRISCSNFVKPHLRNKRKNHIYAPMYLAAETSKRCCDSDFDLLPLQDDYWIEEVGVDWHATRTPDLWGRAKWPDDSRYAIQYGPIHTFARTEKFEPLIMKKSWLKKLCGKDDFRVPMRP